MLKLSHTFIFCILLGLWLAEVDAAHPIDSEFQTVFAQKDYQSALYLVKQALEQDADNGHLYYLAGQSYMGLKQYKNAVEAATQAVIKDPKTSEHFRLLADTEVLKQIGAENTPILRLPSLARRVKRNYQTAINLDSNNLKAREGLGLFYLLAPRIVGGSINKAKLQADEIAKLDNDRAYPFYIGIEKKARRWEKAYALVETWKQANPRAWRAQEELFRIYFEQKQYETAALTLLDWLDTNPNEMNANYLLGLLASDSGLYLEEGRDALLKYLATSPELNQPGHEWSYYRLATIYKSLGEQSLAREAAEQALNESPENTKVATLVNSFLRNLG